MNYAAQNHNAQANVDIAKYQGEQKGAFNVPRTVASAIGRVDGLNDRLNELAKRLDAISDQIGGPRPTNCGDPKGQAPSAGAVGHLHDSVEVAHSRLSEIDDVVASIARALG